MTEKLTNQEIMRVVNRYIGVTQGYLGDFSYRSHQEFYPEYCDLSIDTYTLDGTTRERFIRILTAASGRDQGKILKGVLDRFPVDIPDAPATRTAKLREELREIALRLEGTAPVANVSPRVTSEVLERALNDAAALISTTGATSGVDRVFTAVHGHLIALCEASTLAYPEDASVVQLFKILRDGHDALKVKGPRAGEIDKVLKAFATILDALQPVRNRASVAHPNKELLAAPEAMLVINAGRTILHYLDAKLV